MAIAETSCWKSEIGNLKTEIYGSPQESVQRGWGIELGRERAFKAEPLDGNCSPHGDINPFVSDCIISTNVRIGFRSTRFTASELKVDS